MSRLTALALAASAALVGLAAAGQAPYTPAPGSTERTAILDALRRNGEDATRIFVVQRLRVADGWAWVVTAPRSRDGSSRYESESALLQRSPAGWRVIDAPCGEADCDTDREIARIRRAHPQAPAVLFAP